MVAPIKLPDPHPDAKLLSRQLLSAIIAEIRKKKQISFARYMELALYAPQLGYYQNALHKLGEQGDFVTAPEMSPLFSYCIANHCATVLRDMHDGDILEFGAGSGVMAADILLALEKMNQLPQHYFILELSAALQHHQRETIQKKAPALLKRVVWLTALPAQPISGVVIANEVLDAMPAHLFMMKNGIKECVVVEDKHQLKLMPVENTALETEIEKYDIDFSENYLSEINLNIQPWIKSVSQSLSKGQVLIIDYGFLRHEYYHPDRVMGTLMCHYRHHAHSDAFFYPGLQDITAHVDFTAVGEAGEANGFSVSFSNQAEFLLHNNLLAFVRDQVGGDAFLQNQGIIKLTSPSEMGELFKVMVLTK